jgi:RNA polymerase sigma-70 factor (ECF subfamily)
MSSMRGMVDLATHDVEARLEQYRTELTGYCYRMLGSSFEAEDAVQETLVRAWRSFDSFEGRAALRSWLYRIATNVCLDMLSGREKRALPMDFGPAQSAETPIGGMLPEAAWIIPAPDGRVLPSEGDPAELAVQRDTLRLAFVVALQQLPPKQRAVLILREVLRWKAEEVAQLLDTTVVSVNSALQRARATIDAADINAGEPLEPLREDQQELLARYVAAFEAYDMESLTSLLHEDARQSMPPFEMWLAGRDDVLHFWFTQGSACRGSRLIPVVANGLPAFGQYKPSGPNGELEPWALQVLNISNGRVGEFTFFLDTERIFPLFGLPLTFPDDR